MSAPADGPVGPRVLHGVGVGRGCAVGTVVVVAPPPTVPADEPAPEDLDTADAQVRATLADVAANLRDQAGQTSAQPLHDMLLAASAMAADPALAAESTRALRSGCGPATAVDRAVEGFAAIFTAAGGDLAERVTDLRSVRHRVVARLLNQPEPGLAPLSGPSVLVAQDLSPADTAGLDLDHVVGIVTELGGRTSHTAIIAGQLGLPCIVRTDGATQLAPGTLVLVDAASGTVTADPSTEQTAEVRRRQEWARRLAADTGPGTTADGRAIPLLANIGSPADAERAAHNGAEGCGLFRTEVLFLDRTQAPTLDEQVTAYRAAADSFAGRKVVVRTLDAGADKPLAFAQWGTEENPALGVRGYRLTRTAPQLLATQLEALGTLVAGLPVDRRRDVWAMAPMIATAPEARHFAAAARNAGVATIGVMIEVPAAALCARDILAEVDFVSLGTNDLAQYTMATDRLRGELADLLDPWQPAVLRLIAATATAGVEMGKPVGVCGESAADPVMALAFVGMGVTSLSMASAAIPAVRYALRAHTGSQCQAIATAALAAPDATAARHAAREIVSDDVRAVLAI